jgi:Asp-tRNA(Asn)/Glu-tRNA(Gln) amidotransferase A subunit family amidase
MRYIRAEMPRGAIHTAFAVLFPRAGAHVLAPAAAPPAHRRLLHDADLAGLPACAPSIGHGDDGQHLGLRLQGPRGSEGLVLAVAEALQGSLDRDFDVADPAAVLV